MIDTSQTAIRSAGDDKRILTVLDITDAVS